MIVEGDDLYGDGVNITARGSGGVAAAGSSGTARKVRPDLKFAGSLSFVAGAAPQLSGWYSLPHTIVLLTTAQHLVPRGRICSGHPRLLVATVRFCSTPEPMGGWVYIMTNRRNGTLYLGTTADLARRVWQHREGVADSFTRRYGLKRLVYAEEHNDILAAKQRELNLKHWPRAWKVRLIHHDNPDWNDLYDRLA